MGVLTGIPDSQFAYVVVVSRRARQLMIGARPLIDNPRSRKTSRIAEEELQARRCSNIRCPRCPRHADRATKPSAASRAAAFVEGAF